MQIRVVDARTARMIIRLIIARPSDSRSYTSFLQELKKTDRRLIRELHEIDGFLSGSWTRESSDSSEKKSS